MGQGSVGWNARSRMMRGGAYGIEGLSTEVFARSSFWGREKVERSDNQALRVTFQLFLDLVVS